MSQRRDGIKKNKKRPHGVKLTLSPTTDPREVSSHFFLMLQLTNAPRFSCERTRQGGSTNRPTRLITKSLLLLQKKEEKKNSLFRGYNSRLSARSKVLVPKSNEQHQSLVLVCVWMCVLTSRSLLCVIFFFFLWLFNISVCCFGITYAN